MSRKGFFSNSILEKQKAPAFRVARCGLCQLYKGCKSPKMEVSGDGKKGIFLLGEAPGSNEDEQGIPFVGKAGNLLKTTLRKLGIDMRRDCWIYNSLICRPPNNASPTDKQIDYCRPNVMKAIEQTNPEVIIPMGNAAAKSLLVPLWRDNIGSITRWVGWNIPSQKLNAWICPNYHPSYIARLENTRQGPVASKIFEETLESAIDRLDVGRPWKEIPNYSSKIDRILDSDKAARIIRKMIEKGGRSAFDYETNMLKPDSEAAKIVSCSICYEGRKTIAFVWSGAAIEAMGEYLRSSRIKKIASNLKFEERWTRRVFGHGVKCWEWDTMLGAHVFDNRRGITSIKFQAFILLGMEDYDHHIKKYLHVKLGNKVNKIEEIDPMELLLYNGLDSLLEFIVADLQLEAFNG